MRIRELQLDLTSDVEGWLAVDAAALAVDVPGLPGMCHTEFVGRLRSPMPGEQHRYWVATDGDRVTGTLELGFNELDNIDNVDVELMVEPAARRRGVGTALTDVAVTQARREGRRRLMSQSVRGLPSGPPRIGAGSLFAATTGATLGQTEVRRRLDVRTADRSALSAQAADLTPSATGYSVVTWDGETPDDIVAGVAVLNSRFLGEAPLGDLAWEPQKFDVARMRALETSRAVRGRRAYSAVARHDDTGEIVGWTELIRQHCPDDYLDQGITLVLPEHRGHRLGLLLKVANLARAWAAEPALTTVDTWNAEENAHMIAINEAVGFRPVDAWDAWQLEL